jgi:hypothetical protein
MVDLELTRNALERFSRRGVPLYPANITGLKTARRDKAAAYKFDIAGGQN